MESDKFMGNFEEDQKELLIVFPSEEEIFEALSNEVLDLIVAKNSQGEDTVVVLPVGPKGHYKYMVERIIAEEISLKNVWFISMDEYLTDEKEWISDLDVLSFRKFMNEDFYGKLPEELVMPVSQRLVPDPNDLAAIPNLVDEKGLDLVIGGIGINGHVAFNEPKPELSIDAFKALKTRVEDIDEVTRAVNSIGDLSGYIEGMPKYCVTIGFYELLQAKRVRLGVFRDWHKGVLKTILNNEPTTTYPVTLFKDHADFGIYLPEHLQVEAGE